MKVSLIPCIDWFVDSDFEVTYVSNNSSQNVSGPYEGPFFYDNITDHLYEKKLKSISWNFQNVSLGAVLRIFCDPTEDYSHVY